MFYLIVIIIGCYSVWILPFQVNNLLQVAQKYQATSSESGPAGVSNNDAQTICNMFVTASWQLAKNHTLNEHGLSKRYACCLQILEVVNHMKDLIEFTNKNNLGPIGATNTNSAATGEQVQRINNSTMKGLATVGTGPSNVMQVSSRSDKSLVDIL
ncbi:hypothetical protein U9M48_011830 [Paspalum notatum var. saurae]|uniref:Uncharacterized protein n=1 Tax=Paspalum notatum var. saurae TaxID=547442 RepID=A0AAQ3SWP5_PASNO